ncbi:MAG: hypothetical protein ABI680_15005 [Chthoniobacteraceae bacterium]
MVGVEDTTDDGYGINDALIATKDTADILSRIASITIAGAVTESPSEGDHFGITAEQIGTLILGGAGPGLNVGDGEIIPLAEDFKAVSLS